MKEIILKDNIVEMDIDSITPYEGSHKTDSNINLLIESVKDFGVNQPITIDKNHVVVTGNGVYKAAKAAGLKTIPCIILDDLTDEEIKQYRIADDKTQEFAQWNEKKLRKELSYLQDPSSMQQYFDQNIVAMLGLNVKTKKDDQVSDVAGAMVASESKAVPEVTEAKKDQMFAESIVKTEKSMEVQAVDMIEYTCSKCGKVIKIRRP